MKKKILSLLTFCATSGYALDYSPWFIEPFQPSFEISYAYAHSHQIKTHYGIRNVIQNDQFLSLMTQMSIYSNWNFQFQTTFAHTNQSCFYWEELALAGQYLWLDDLAGDKISLSTAVTLIGAPLSVALKDYSVIHHSHLDSELSLVLGKEWTHCARWLGHYWLMGVVGQGVEGKPWVRAKASMDHQFILDHAIGLSVDYEKGCGNKQWIAQFPGYSKLDYKILDGQISYNYFFKYGGSLEIQYAYRFYVKNSPAEVNSVKISLNWPLSF